MGEAFRRGKGSMRALKTKPIRQSIADLKVYHGPEDSKQWNQEVKMSKFDEIFKPGEEIKDPLEGMHPEAVFKSMEIATTEDEDGDDVYKLSEKGNYSVIITWGNLENFETGDREEADTWAFVPTEKANSRAKSMFLRTLRDLNLIEQDDRRERVVHDEDELEEFVDYVNEEVAGEKFPVKYSTDDNGFRRININKPKVKKNKKK